MKYWEKNETDGMIEKEYLYTKKAFQRKYTSISVNEEFIRKRFHIRVCNLFLMDIPNFTFGGFSI